MRNKCKDIVRDVSTRQGEVCSQTVGYDLSRIILIGPRASGKSTVSARLACQLNLVHVELDAINRNKDGSPVSELSYTNTLTTRVRQPRWIVDGDYLEGIDRLALPIVWPMATTVIWLDLSFLITVRRLVFRTYRRIVHKEKAWGDMHDSKSSLMKRLVSGNAVRAYWNAKRVYPALLKRPEYSHLTFIHLKKQSEIDAFLSSITAAGFYQGARECLP